MALRQEHRAKDVIMWWRAKVNIVPHHAKDVVIWRLANPMTRQEHCCSKPHKGRRGTTGAVPKTLFLCEAPRTLSFNTAPRMLHQDRH